MQIFCGGWGKFMRRRNTLIFCLILVSTSSFATNWKLVWEGEMRDYYVDIQSVKSLEPPHVYAKMMQSEKGVQRGPRWSFDTTIWESIFN
jgi:hypothetical protein